MQNVLCFYHKADLDGKCSGAIVKNFVPQAEMIPFDYGDQFPWNKITGQKTVVYMVDVSLSKDEMYKLNDRCCLYYIDHHKSKLEELDLDQFGGLQVDGTGACILTWKFFSKQDDVPFAVELLGRYDVWDLDDQVLNFQNGMLIENTDPEAHGFWNRLFNTKWFGLDMIDQICENGQTIRNYKENSDGRNINTFGFLTEFRGFKVLALNKTTGSSLIFKDHPEYHNVDILMIFGWTGVKWKISLYTLKDFIDVSMICKEFSGGGHKAAAGMSFKELPKEFHVCIFGY